MRLLVFFLVIAVTPALAQVPGNSPPSSTQKIGHGATCINRRLIRSIEPDGPAQLRFRMQVGVDYRSKLADVCPFTPGAQQFAMRSIGGSSDLCEGDTLDIVSGQSGSAYGSCQVGPFIAVKKGQP